MLRDSVELTRDIFDRFAATLVPEDAEILTDVRDYLEWQARRRGAFTPSASDDVDLRTYLLHLQTSEGEGDHATLQKRLASLKRFYGWALAEGIIDVTPFAAFDSDWPALTRDQISPRQASSTANFQESEINHLRALNHLAQELNRSADMQTALDATLVALVKVMGLRTAWISLLTDGSVPTPDGDTPSGHGFRLAAACGLPPGLEQDDRYHLRRPPECRCQSLLRSGRLTHAVNIVECTRLMSAASAAGDTKGLLFHASVPIISQGRPLGVLNVATEAWQRLTASDLQLLSAVGAQVAIALERARLYDLAQAQRLRLERELAMARTVQAHLIPSQPPQIPGYDVAADWRAAHEVAGDFYDIFPLSDGRWGLVIADVCGKGAPAALCMTMTHSMIRAAADDTRGPTEVLTKVNRTFTARVPADTFVTVFYGILDPTAHMFTYANAGHNLPLVRRSTPAGKTEPLLGGNLPIGLLKEIALADATIHLAPGDALVAYTDGLTEVFNAKQEMFGSDRLSQLIGALPQTSAQQLLDAIVTEVTVFAGGAPQQDDITLLVISPGELSNVYA